MERGRSEGTVPTEKVGEVMGTEAIRVEKLPDGLYLSYVVDSEPFLSALGRSGSEALTEILLAQIAQTAREKYQVGEGYIIPACIYNPRKLH